MNKLDFKKMILLMVFVVIIVLSSVVLLTPKNDNVVWGDQVVLFTTPGQNSFLGIYDADFDYLKQEIEHDDEFRSVDQVTFNPGDDVNVRLWW